MKNAKKILLTLLCLAFLVFSLTLVACDNTGNTDDNNDGTNSGTNGGTNDGTNGGDSACNHTFGEWTTVSAPTCTTDGSETRTCSICNAVNTKVLPATGHNGSIICETCYAPTFKEPTVDFAAIDSLGVEVENFTFANPGDLPEYSVDGVITLEKLFVKLAEDGTLSGYGKGTVTFKNTATANSTNNVTAYIESNVLYIALEGGNFASSTVKDTNQYAQIDLTKIPNLYQLYDALSQADQAEAMLNELLPKIETWYNETLSPIFANVKVDGAKATVDTVTANTVKFINSLFTATKAEDGTTTVSLNFATLKDVNNTLYTTKISALIDLIVDDGTYASIKELLTSDTFYTFTVSDLLNYVQVTQGVDLVKVLDAIDALLVIVTGAEDVTLEQVIASQTGAEFPEGFDFSAYLTNESILPLRVIDGLQMMMAGAITPDDESTTDVNEALEAEKAVKDAIAGIFSTLESVTLYDMIAPQYDAEEGDENADETPDYALTFKNGIDETIDLASEGLTIAFTVDAQGTLATFTLGYADGPGRVSATVSKDGVKVEYAVNGEGMPVYDIEFTIITNNAIEPDGTKLAEIKAKINAIPELTAELIGSYFDEYYNMSSVYVDEETGILYHYQYYSSYTTEDGYCVTYLISAYDVDTIFALFALDSCTDAIEIQYTLARASQKVEFYFESSSDAEVTENMIISAIKDFYADEVEPDAMTFIYNTKTQTFGFDSCHNYVLDEENSVYTDACGGMNKDHYVCSVCGDYYDDYYSNEHDLVIVTENENGVYKAHLECGNDGCDYVGEYVANITIDTNATLTPTDIIDGNTYGRTPIIAFECDINETDFRFKYTIESDSNQLDAVCINLYAYNETEGTFSLLSNINVYQNGDYPAYIDNSYDKVYLVICIYESDLEYGSSNVVIGIEKIAK